MPSHKPVALVGLEMIQLLVNQCAVVICAGGGGIPVVRDADGYRRGVEAVIDKDRGAALLARDLGADALMILTDIGGVEIGFDTPEAHPIGHTTVADLRRQSFPAGSMGPKVDAACGFVEATGKPAMIGNLANATDLLRVNRGPMLTS